MERQRVPGLVRPVSRGCQACHASTAGPGDPTAQPSCLRCQCIWHAILQVAIAAQQLCPAQARLQQPTSCESGLPHLWCQMQPQSSFISWLGGMQCGTCCQHARAAELSCWGDCACLELRARQGPGFLPQRVEHTSPDLLLGQAASSCPALAWGTPGC